MSERILARAPSIHRLTVDLHTRKQGPP